MSYAAALRGEQPPPPEPQQPKQQAAEGAAEEAAPAAKSRRGRQAEEEQAKLMTAEVGPPPMRKPLSYADAVGCRTTLAPTAESGNEKQDPDRVAPHVVKRVVVPGLALDALPCGDAAAPACPASGALPPPPPPPPAVEISDEQRAVIEEMCASPRQRLVAEQLLLAKLLRERDGAPCELVEEEGCAVPQQLPPFGVACTPPPMPLPAPALPPPRDHSPLTLAVHHASSIIVHCLQQVYPEPINVRVLMRQISWKKMHARRLGSLHTYVRRYGTGVFHYTGQSMVQLCPRYAPAHPHYSQDWAAGSYRQWQGMSHWEAGPAAAPGAEPAATPGDGGDAAGGDNAAELPTPGDVTPETAEMPSPSPGELTPGVRSSDAVSSDASTASACPMP